MDYFSPLHNGFTVYTKKDCNYCTKVKKLLTDKKIYFIDVECDQYLIEDKEGFLFFIKEKANKEYKTFPMVFKDKKFIGGFTETQELINKELCFDDIIF